jgi:hypothetical protein
MKHFFSKLLFVGCCALACACEQAQEGRDIREYYFPLKSLTDGVVYEFHSVNNDTLPIAYWYFRSILQGEGHFLTATYYDPKFIQQQHTRERLVDNGVLLEDMYIYEKDSTQTSGQIQVPIKIVAGNLFPFLIKKNSGVWLYRVEWDSKTDVGAHYTVIRNRRFAGDTTFVLNGTTYPAIQFKLKEAFEYDKEGVLAPPPYAGLEIYAKGIGLVYYRKEVSASDVLEYRLAERYEMSKLEQQFRQQIKRNER